MSIAISGMMTANKQLQTASHNLANAETNGFKTFRNIVGDAYATVGINSVDMSGVGLITSSQQFNQGSLKVTGNAFDLGIDGKGFFILKNGGETLYSRAGVFYQDKNHQLLSPSGYALQGFNISDKGVVDHSRIIDMKVDARSMQGTASTAASASLNLNAGVDAIDRKVSTFDPALPSTYHDYSTFNLYDSLGGQHTLGTFFSKTGSNEWEVSLRLDNQTPVDGGKLTFDNNGQLKAGNGIVKKAFPLSSLGAEDLNVTIDLSDAHQFDADFSFRPKDVDGNPSGTLNRVVMSGEGFIEATYSNGNRKMLGQVALATFPSECGLVVDGNNCWRSSFNSGTPVYSPSGMNGAGRVVSGELEQSNTDMPSTLSDIIVGQRNFQMSAKAFKAEDSLFQTIINIT